MQEHNVSHLDNFAVYFIFFLDGYNEFYMRCFWKVVWECGQVLLLFFFFFLFFLQEQLRS